MSTIRTRLLLVAAMLSSLILTGCVPTVPGATPTVVPSTTPTATPVPDAPETRVVITTLSVDVYSDDALTDSWPHADHDPVEITALADYFGLEPAVTRESGPGEGSDSTFEIQSWPGFEIRYIVSEYGPKNFFITVTAASVGGVEINASGGAQVGDDLQALAASDPTATSTVPTPDGDLLRVKLDQIPSSFEGYDGPGADFVSAQSLSPFTTVTTIYGPQKNYGL